MKNQTKINQNLDKYIDCKKALKNYNETESSPLLRRFAAESNRERARGLERDFKKLSKIN